MRLLAVLWASALVSCAGAFVIPDQLVSLLTVIYSSIPPIRKGSDSRVGVGFRLGPFADVQLVLELGPQINTQALDRPMGFGKRETDPDKRDVDPGKRPDIQLLDESPVGAERRSGRRSGRSRAVAANEVVPKRTPSTPPALQPQRQPHKQRPPAAVTGDWLSRWRSSFTPQPQPTVWAASQARAVSVLDPVVVPQESAPAPASIRTTRMLMPVQAPVSQGVRWEAMDALRRLHWAGQQGG